VPPAFWPANRYICIAKTVNHAEAEAEAEAGINASTLEMKNLFDRRRKKQTVLSNPVIPAHEFGVLAALYQRSQIIKIKL
jgi:hypothetical protein